MTRIRLAVAATTLAVGACSGAPSNNERSPGGSLPIIEASEASQPPESGRMIPDHALNAAKEGIGYVYKYQLEKALSVGMPRYVFVQGNQSYTSTCESAKAAKEVKSDDYITSLEPACPEDATIVVTEYNLMAGVPRQLIGNQTVERANAAMTIVHSYVQFAAPGLADKLPPDSADRSRRREATMCIVGDVIHNAGKEQWILDGAQMMIDSDGPGGEATPEVAGFMRGYMGSGCDYN